jgi:hypothetical protein
MKRTGMVISLFVLLSAVPFSGAYSATLDCPGGIISAGDTRVDLLGKCGEPDSKEFHEEEISEQLDRGVRRKLFVNVEDWTYNFGPNQLQRIVTLKNGTVAHIRTGNYGFSKNAKPDQAECSEQIVSRGDSKSDVLAKCGEPSWKDTHEEELGEKLEGGVERRQLVKVEEWTYNLGTNRFVRILTFRNDRLFDIKTGGYGYDTKQR